MNNPTTVVFSANSSPQKKRSSNEANHYIQDRFGLKQEKYKYPYTIGGLNRDGLVDLWRGLGYKVGAEVGVDLGTFAKLIFEGIPGLKMYLVDPYAPYHGNVRHVKRNPEAKSIASKSLKGFDTVWIEEVSETAFKKIKDGSLDFVYIDGNHRYDYVMLDIILWSRKVRKGGMVSGHDYNTKGRNSEREVKIAVDHYTKFHRITPWFITDNKARHYKPDRHASWFWIK